MASTKVIMPQMGESVAEGTVAKWLKAVGDEVARDENILEISTDKIDVEVPSPTAGYLAEILVDEGETVEVGTAIAIITDEKGESIEDPETAKAEVSEDDSAEKSEDKEEKKQSDGKKEDSDRSDSSEEDSDTSESKDTDSDKKKPITASSDRGGKDKRKFYTPVVLRMASEHDIDLEKIDGTGMGGRVTKKDVQKYLDEGPKEQPETGKEQKKEDKRPAYTPPKVDASGDNVEIVEMSNVRKKTAEHMVHSKQTSAHVHSSQEVDMTNVVRWRDSVKDEFKKKNGFPLSYMAIVSKVVCDAIKDFPRINSSVDGDRIVIKKDINIGMAVALPDETLIVPVIRNAGHLNVTGLSHAIVDLADRARNKKLTMDDITGGTFTITNYGVFGTVFGTPIINQPQVAILGTGIMKRRPWVVELEDGTETIAIRTIMGITLGYDHRIIDGGYGGKFTASVAERLENWKPENDI